MLLHDVQKDDSVDIMAVPVATGLLSIDGQGQICYFSNSASLIVSEIPVVPLSVVCESYAVDMDFMVCVPLLN